MNNHYLICERIATNQVSHLRSSKMISQMLSVMWKDIRVKNYLIHFKIDVLLALCTHIKKQYRLTTLPLVNILSLLEEDTSIINDKRVNWAKIRGLIGRR